MPRNVHFRKSLWEFPMWGNREEQADSALSKEPKLGPDPMTWAKIKNRTFNRPSHPGTPRLGTLSTMIWPKIFKLRCIVVMILSMFGRPPGVPKTSGVQEIKTIFLSKTTKTLFVLVTALIVTLIGQSGARLITRNKVLALKCIHSHCIPHILATRKHITCFS